MIPLLIYTLIKKFGKRGLQGSYLNPGRFAKTVIHIICMGLLLAFLALIPLLSKGQELQLNYKIVQGGDDIGWLRLEKNVNGSRSTLALVSEIRTRFIFLITVSAKESSTFENGKLVHSSQYRKTNGDTKLDKQTRLVANKYEVTENGENEMLPMNFIGINLLCLYFQEPVGVDWVYCDNHECFAKVTRMDDGGYKIKFPGGDSNCYYYSKGICTKVKISHTFYSAEVILKP